MNGMNISVKDIKSILLQCHKERGYQLPDSFPIVSSDPTIMFVNATITPFKHFYSSDPEIQRYNYAFVQRCFRLGGASELDLVGTNPYYHTFFEMFGSGTFGINHREAIEYLLELLATLKIEQQRLYYTVPSRENFRSALVANGVSENHIFTLENNSTFWQEWKFGKLGPVGYGLTAIYSRSLETVNSVDQMALDIDRFVPFLCLIYVAWEETSDDRIIPITNPGFDLGIGIERLAAVLQKCNTYQIDSISPLVAVVTHYLSSVTSRVDEKITRIVADHLRAICMLIDEGVLPSNKKHGYALRKLIRRCLELVWNSAGQVILTEILIERFCDQLEQCSGQRIPCSAIVNVVKEESQALYKVIQKAKRILEKQPDIHPDVLWDTYGLSSKLVTVIKRKEDTK